MSARPVLAKEQYVKRHDRVCAELRLNVCKEMVLNLTTNTGMTVYQN